MVEFEHFHLIDTPGLNDPNMSTSEWQTVYNDWVEQHDNDVRIDLAVLVFKQKVRPSLEDANSLAVLKHAIASCKPTNLVIVFTFCDEINPNKKRQNAGQPIFDKDYAYNWYNETLRGSKSG